VQQGPNRYSDSLLAVDFAERTVDVGGHGVDLTDAQLDLLARLVANPGDAVAADDATGESLHERLHTAAGGIDVLERADAGWRYLAPLGY
jgi:DNA-binding response OmpR family regulator